MNPVTTTLKSLTESTPAEIDAQLFPLLSERWRLGEAIGGLRHSIAPSIFPEGAKAYNARIARFGKGRLEVLDVTRPWEVQQFERYCKHLAIFQDELARNAEEIQPFDDEFDRRGGWTRYVLVGNGHLHKQNCHTLRWTTRRFLLAESSGLTADEVVAKYSYTACTHCFPDAPVVPKSTVKPGNCEGSGKGVRDVNGSLRLYRRWGVCSVCGESVSATSLYNARQHKAKKEAS